MAETTVSILASKVNENGLKFVENNGQILFSAEEIGRQLSYKRPAKSILFTTEIKKNWIVMCDTSN